MNREDTVRLKDEMGTLAAMTCDARWDDDKAKPIGVAQWRDALVLAVLIDRAVPGLPAPVPGADPTGFVWLTYHGRDSEFALEITSSLLGPRYRWTATKDGTKTKHDASGLRPVVEALRAVFGDTERSRILKISVDSIR